MPSHDTKPAHRNEIKITARIDESCFVKETSTFKNTQIKIVLPADPKPETHSDENRLTGNNTECRCTLSCRRNSV